MTTLDQFESVFKSAIKPLYRHNPVSISHAVIVTDLAQDAANEFMAQVRKLLAPQQIENWEVITGDEYHGTLDLLQLLETKTADLICCYRNLHSYAWQHPHSLGSHLDVLIQKTSSPVLILPHPQAGYAYAHAYNTERRVLAMTDHMTDDDKLISMAAKFTGQDGRLTLAHIEDEVTFDRYIEAIGKIETIDTDNAALTIRQELLKYPTDYLNSCSSVLTQAFPSMSVETIVAFGRKLSDYKSYVDDLEINLLLMHGKDEDQLAMHGLSYPLAIEIRQIPLLII
jgi:hypothetical protein